MICEFERTKKSYRSGIKHIRLEKKDVRTCVAEGFCLGPHYALVSFVALFVPFYWAALGCETAEFT